MKYSQYILSHNDSIPELVCYVPIARTLSCTLSYPMHTRFPLTLTPTQGLIAYVAVGGIYVLSSYAYLLPRSAANLTPDGRASTLDALWFGIDGSERTAFYVSIVVAAIAFLVATMRFARTVTWASFPALCVAYSIFFVGAMLWTMSLWWWTLDAYTTLARLTVIIALCLTTLGAAMLVREAWVVRKDAVAAMAAGLVLVHVGLFDNGRWAAAFLGQ